MNQGSSDTSPIVATRAYEISKVFFKDMVNSGCDRIHTIIHAQANMSAAEAATAAAESQDSTTPQMARNINRTLANLYLNRTLTNLVSSAHLSTSSQPHAYQPTWSQPVPRGGSRTLANIVSTARTGDEQDVRDSVGLQNRQQNARHSRPNRLRRTPSRC